MAEKQERHPGGAPTKYKEDFSRMAYVACSQGGFTDQQLADLFSVSRRTIDYWKHKHLEFLHTIKRAKAKFDYEVVEKAFFKRCTGYYYTETIREPDEPGSKKMVVIRKTRKHIVPDAKGCMDWLCNRAPDRWKKLKHIELGGKDGGPIKNQTLVMVPSGPMTIAQWEKEVKEARKAEPERLRGARLGQRT